MIMSSLAWHARGTGIVARVLHQICWGVTSAGTALLARGHQDSEKALILFFLLISAGNTNYFSSASYDG